MRILMAGASGFLGSHLSDLLLGQGHEVVGVDNYITGRKENVAHLDGNPKWTHIEHDLIQPLKLDGPVDRIYHMASPASPKGYYDNQVATMKVNSEGTWNLLELALEKGARVLMASTSECYGDPQVNPQPESYWGNVNPIGLRSMYDEAKRFAEACMMAYHRERNADTRIIRIFNTYGPRMDPTDGRVVINFIKQALHDEPLTVYGDGKQTRSLCYVSDLVDGINRVMECDFVEPVNLGNPSELTVLQIAEEVLNLIPHSRSKIEHLPLPGVYKDDPKVRRPDIGRARELLGWEPKVERREGLGKMIEFYRERL
ncbi:MAG: UDP-glucuronic acid decarboxylase family protein [Planctomycetota bacterium]